MAGQVAALRTPKTLLISFSNTEINLIRLVAGHWAKMWTCNEIDRGEVPGMSFIQVWSPFFTVEKLQAVPSFRTDMVERDPYEVGIGRQLDWPLCQFELSMLKRMVCAAVEGRLNSFMMMDKGVMQDVLGPVLTQSWTCNASAGALAQKLTILEEVAGLFEGHSLYQSVERQMHGLQGVEYA